MAAWTGVAASVATVLAAGWAMWRFAVKRFRQVVKDEVQGALAEVMAEVQPNGLDAATLGTTAARIERKLDQFLTEQHPPPTATT